MSIILSVNYAEWRMHSIIMLSVVNAHYHYAEGHYAQCYYAECRMLHVIMLGVVMLSVEASKWYRLLVGSPLYKFAPWQGALATLPN